MKEKFWAAIFFIDQYPGSIYILTGGLFITALYFFYGANVVSEMKLTNSSPIFQDAVRNVVIGKYQEKSLVLLILVLFSAYKKFEKDKKKYDRYG